MLKLPITDPVTNIHLPKKKDIYPYPVIPSNNLSSQHEHKYQLNSTQTREAMFYIKS